MENINSKIIDLVLQGKTFEEAKAECGYNSSKGEIHNPICGVFFENYRKIGNDMERFQKVQELQKTDSHEILLCYDRQKEYSNYTIICFHDFSRVVYDRIDVKFLIFDDNNKKILGIDYHNYFFGFAYDGRAIIDWRIRPLLKKARIDINGYDFYIKSAGFSEQDVKNFADKLSPSNLHYASDKSLDLDEKMGNQTIGIIGEFDCGRSTLLNILLGEELIPTDFLPTTERATRISWYLFPKASYVSHDGREIEIQLNDIEKYITSDCKESRVSSADIDEVIVRYPCKYCIDEIDCIDFMELPGYNCDEQRDQIADAKLHELDAAIILLKDTCPFSHYDEELLCKLLNHMSFDRIMFVLNLTFLDSEDVEQTITNFKRKIAQGIKDYCDLKFGKQEILDNALNNLNITIVPMPMGRMIRNIREGKPEHNHELLKEFDEELNRLKQSIRSYEWKDTFEL